MRVPEARWIYAGDNGFRAVSGGSVLVVLLLVCGNAEADFGANVGLSLVHSDNVTLAEAGAEQGESLAEVTAGFDYSRSHGRINADVSYQAQSVAYEETTDANAVYHQLDATSRIALVLDRFFLDMFGVVDQAVVNPLGTFSLNNLSRTSNRTDVAITGGGPTLALPVGDFVEGELGYQSTKLDYEDPTIRDSEESIAHFSMTNSSKQRGFSWSVDFADSNYRYADAPGVGFETLEVDLGGWINSGLRIFTTQGLESDYAEIALAQSAGPGASIPGPGLDDHYWYTGLEWSRNERGTVLVSVGKRSFGNAYRLEWSRNVRNGGISLSYSEEPSTFLREQLRSVQRYGEIVTIDFLDGPGSNRLYLTERVNLGFNMQRSKGSVNVRIFNENRFDIGEKTLGSVPSDERLSGADFNLQWQYAVRSSLDVSAQLARRESTISNLRDDIQFLTVTLSRQIGRQGTLSFILSKQSQDPRPGSSSATYDEHEIQIGISRRFGESTGGGPFGRPGSVDVNTTGR